METCNSQQPVVCDGTSDPPSRCPHSPPLYPRTLFQDMVIAITEAVISTVHGVGRILYLRPFNEHVGTSVTDGPNIQDIVRGSRAFRTTSADLSAKVEADFSEAEVKTSVNSNTGQSPTVFTSEMLLAGHLRIESRITCFAPFSVNAIT